MKFDNQLRAALLALALLVEHRATALEHRAMQDRPTRGEAPPPSKAATGVAAGWSVELEEAEGMRAVASALRAVVSTAACNLVLPLLLLYFYRNLVPPLSRVCFYMRLLCYSPPK